MQLRQRTSPFRLRGRAPLWCTIRFVSQSFQRSVGRQGAPPAALRNIPTPKGFHSHHGSSAEQLQKRAEKALLLQLQQQVLWEGTVIDNTDHQLVNHFRQLSSNEKYRSAKRMMCVGGGKLIQELVNRGQKPSHLLIKEGCPIPQWAKKGTDICVISRKLSASQFPGSDGYIGDFRIPDPPFKETLIANKQKMKRIVVLDNVSDPGHVGSVLRTAAGFFYDAVILTNHCADLYDNRVVRAARGAHFQSAVPFFSLREEDGDDVSGMLAHVVHRNKLNVASFTSLPDTYASKQDSRLSTSAVDSAPVEDGGLPLNEFCSRSFSSAASRDDGLMLFLSPNLKGVAQQKARRFSPTCTTLLLDYPMDDFLAASSVVLHALRPNACDGYLPVSGDVAASLRDTSKVDIGADRLMPSWPNLDESEQLEKANLRNEFKKWARLNRRKRSDMDYWMSAEVSRINRSMKAHKSKMEAPWIPQRAENSFEKVPQWVPNVMDEYRQSHTRDFLQAERDLHDVEK